LRRTDIIRINSHNVSEHSPSDLGAWTRRSKPRWGVDTPDTLSRSDIKRTTESVVGCQSSVVRKPTTSDGPPTSRSHASRDAPEPDSP